ncbi:MAG: 2-oxo-hepta-3-ene-1,7-dioic acid hydratase [Hyphomicrobiales bacterium]|nr:MAG: 2-oxo-hepta-3-ene-1,7-dioic acid hydratase [Hyphomicrobiales bacterium]
MITPEQVSDAAEQLYEAERTRKQIRLLTLQFPDMVMDDAYEVQKALVQKKLSSGNAIKGWKIGLTSKAMQAALNIDIPDSGVLFEDMFFDDGAVIPKDRFIQTRIEAEIAFIMKSDLKGPNVTVEDVIKATDHVRPSLEILDTRIMRLDPETGKIRTIVDTISDNAANAGIVLGGKPVAPTELDLRWIGAIVSRNGEVEETGLGAGVLNEPAKGIAWLANRLAQYGDMISAGQTVLSGSFIRPIEARHGDKIFADFGPFGTVSCDFE